VTNPTDTLRVLLVDQMTRLLGAFPSHKIPDAERHVDACVDALGDLDPAYIREGARLIIQREQYYPAPGIWRRYAMEARDAALAQTEAATPKWWAGGETEVCPMCHATRFWYRHHVAPAVGVPGTRQYRPARHVTRIEVFHGSLPWKRGGLTHLIPCPARRADQPNAWRADVFPADWPEDAPAEGGTWPAGLGPGDGAPEAANA
jgi:hypothetical protein